MYEVNRSIALIRPLAPFHAWLQQLPGGLTAACRWTSWVWIATRC